MEGFKREKRLAEISLNVEYYESHLSKVEEIEWEYGVHYAELLSQSLAEASSLPDELILPVERENLLNCLKALIMS